MTQIEMNACKTCGHQWGSHATHAEHHKGGMKAMECNVPDCTCKEYVSPLPPSDSEPLSPNVSADKP